MFKSIEYRRDWNDKNKEKCRKYRRDYYTRHKKEKGTPPPRSRQPRVREAYVHKPELKMFMASKRRAKEKGLDHTISKDDIVIPSHCPLLGIPIFANSKIAGPNSPSLDRKNNSLGYVPGNVWVISFKANVCKGAMTADEIILLGKRLKKFEKK